MPHGITQSYLPPGRGDIPALTPAEAGTRLSDPEGCKAEFYVGAGTTVGRTAGRRCRQSVGLVTRSACVVLARGSTPSVAATTNSDTSPPSSATTRSATDGPPSVIVTGRKLPVTSVALGPWAVGTPAERGPLLESIYRVSLTVDLCEGNKIISLKNYFTTASWGPLKKKKKSGGLGTCPLIKTALDNI